MIGLSFTPLPGTGGNLLLLDASTTSDSQEVPTGTLDRRGLVNRFRVVAEETGSEYLGEAASGVAFPDQHARVPAIKDREPWLVNEPQLPSEAHEDDSLKVYGQTATL